GTPDPLIRFNNITHNGAYPIRIGADMRVSDNTFTGNGVEAVEVVTEEVKSNTTWSNNIPAYIVSGEITVRHSNWTSSGNSFVTLTIEAGVAVRFAPGAGLTIGKPYYSNNPSHNYGYYGALSAKGTTDAPITFTSNADGPAPGDWKGIYIGHHAKDDHTIVEFCVVEYGGAVNNANIRLYHAKPVIRYSTIRNSSHAGILADSSGCNGANILCNNFRDNHHGVHTKNNARPILNDNNFLRNLQYGVFNDGGASTLNTENNWWGDGSGPGFSGDQILGNVDFTPWLPAGSGCIDAPPENGAPFAPKGQGPSDGAVRVAVFSEGLPVDVSLTWAGGDPNPWDAVVYDLHFGESAEELTLVASDLVDRGFAAPDLQEGVTYYWKVVARDNHGEETEGPVSSFTTLGADPDLIVSAIQAAPASPPRDGDVIALTATIQNIGAGPAVDPFTVQFMVGGAGAGIRTIHEVIPAGGSKDVGVTWTAQYGDHAVEAIADAGAAVVESDEENNAAARGLPHVQDPAPPEFMGSDPAHGEATAPTPRVVITLLDRHGQVDDAATAASLTVVDANLSGIAGTVVEADDRFTFYPDASPLPDGVYTVSFTASDMDGNAGAHNFSFTVDGAPSNAPAITGGV
ncbi:MAG: hypothetical protein GY867_04565, partial [bacterium]|nr:hypothetical protein [bacterium]